MTDENSGRHQTTITLSSAFNDRINEYIEENAEYTSKADFFRKAASEEMSSADAGGSSDSAPVEQLEGEITEIRDGMQDLKAEMANLHDLFETIEVRTRQPSTDIQELETELFDYLPTKEEVEAVRDSGSDSVRDAWVGPDRTTPTTGRPDDLTEEVDAARMEVLEALTQLQQDTSLVHTMEIDGETWYYKEG